MIIKGHDNLTFICIGMICIGKQVYGAKNRYPPLASIYSIIFN